MGSYSSGGEILPKQCSFVPHFRGSFSWLAIGKNINLAAFVPLEALEAGVILRRCYQHQHREYLRFVPIPRGVIHDQLVFREIWKRIMHFSALSFFSLRFFFNTRGTPGTRTVQSASIHLNSTRTARYHSTFHVNLAKFHRPNRRDPACGRLRVLACLSNGVFFNAP